MGCGLFKNDAKVRRSTAIEILDEDQAVKHEGVSIVECMIKGEKTKIFYKLLYPSNIKSSMTSSIESYSKLKIF